MFVGKTCLFTILSMYLYQLRLDCAWTALGSLAPRPYARTCFQPTRWAPSGETHPIPMDKNQKRFPIEMAIWRYLLVSDNTYIILLILTRISHFFPIFLGVFVISNMDFWVSHLPGILSWHPMDQKLFGLQIHVHLGGEFQKRMAPLKPDVQWVFKKHRNLWIYIYIWNKCINIYICIHGVMIFSRFPTFLSWGLL